MKAQIVPPNIRIAELLQQLKLKSIQDLISGDSFQIDTLAKTTSIHPQLIRTYLHELQQLLIGKPASANKPSIQVDNIVKKWLYPSRSEPTDYQEQVKTILQEGDIIEVVGRVGSGKSYIINQIIIECLLSQIEIIYLDGSGNLDSLLHRIYLETMTNPQFDKEHAKMRSFSFRTQTDLLMTLHALGDWNAQNPDRKPWIFVDSLIRTDQTQIENGPTVNTLEFKSAEKIKRMLYQLSRITGAIVFTTKCMNLNGLFQTIYKHEKHRPKGVGACSKQWDNVANKTICVDYARTNVGSQNLWLNFSKNPDCTVYKFRRQL